MLRKLVENDRLAKQKLTPSEKVESEFTGNTACLPLSFAVF
jgi:hypothetical protein